MITTFKDATAKAMVALVAAAMVFSLFAPAAQAQSTEDLQKMINDLLAQIASLQSQVGQGSTSVASGVCPYTWTRDLTVGSTGPDVMKLQQFLNADADTRVAAEGAGSVGMETEFFGPATAAAVSKMQVKYRAEVLSPAGLVNPTGFFGPSSRAKANSVCVAAPVTPTPDVDEDEDEMEDEDEDDNDGPVTLRGEASLDVFETDDADETEVQEGETDVVIGVFTVEFTNGDAEISRLDVRVNRTDASPWDAFETLSLWVDGDMIAEVDASDEDDYLDEDQGTIRFSNLGLVAMEDEELEILVGASIQNNLDSDELGAWTLRADAMRFFDADGVAETDVATGDLSGPAVADFVIEEAGQGEELRFSLASNNPDATDIIVDEDNTTNNVTILRYDIEAEEGDIELDRLVVRIDTPSEDPRDVVNDIELVIGGQTFRDEEMTTDFVQFPSRSYASTTGFFAWYVFDIDGDIVIDEDDEETVEVVVDFKRQTGNYDNGDTIQARVTSDERALTVAEGADDLASSDFKGSAVGEIHTLVAAGIVVPVDGFDSSSITQGENDTLGSFTLEFEVTAVEGDFYIADVATLGTAATTGVEFTVEGGTATSSGTLSSSADEDTPGVFVVREGETETFTLTVTVDPVATGQYRVQLGNINYTIEDDGVTDTEPYTPTPVQDFRTTFRTIQGS